MKVPLVTVAVIAPDTPDDAACAAAMSGVVMVAVTAIEPAAKERVMLVASTPAADASAAM
eukprot:6790279-Prymnesium_polylepis.1